MPTARLRLCSSGSRRSIDIVTRPGMALGMFGVTSSRPTVATMLPRICRGISRTPLTTSAAATRASCRMRMGVGPAWSCTPWSVSRDQEMATMPSTTPTGTCSSSRMGPCSMCSSR